jgi:hypothetical protein
MAFTLRDWVISLILFGGMIALGFIMITSHATDYDATHIIDSELQSRYNILTNTTDTANSIYESVSQPGGLTVIGSFNILFSSVFIVLQLVLQTITLPATLIGNMMIDLGVPTSVAAVVVPMWLAVITLLIVFAMLSINTRRDI